MNRLLGIAAVFASGLLAIPAVLLFQAAVDWVGDRIEAAWPGQAGAAARLGIRLLAPAVLAAALAAVMVTLLVDLWDRRGPGRPGPSRQELRNEGP